MREFANAIRELRRTFGRAFDDYRPELHYMRGPGPKWHAKRGSLTTKSVPAVTDTSPALGDIAEAHA